MMRTHVPSQLGKHGIVRFIFWLRILDRSGTSSASKLMPPRFFRGLIRALTYIGDNQLTRCLSIFRLMPMRFLLITEMTNSVILSRELSLQLRIEGYCFGWRGRNDRLGG